MKPDWKDAPEWAQWLAMDEDGTWRWHSGYLTTFHGKWISGEQSQLAAKQEIPKWDDTAEMRPQTTNPDARPGSEGQGA